MVSPAAICRKVALADDGDEIEVWGDAQQIRSYCYIDDCVEGIYLLMRSDFREPLNLGSDRMVTINELVDIVAEAPGRGFNAATTSPCEAGIRTTRAFVRSSVGSPPRASRTVWPRHTRGFMPSSSFPSGFRSRVPLRADPRGRRTACSPRAFAALACGMAVLPTRVSPTPELSPPP